jgi:uncharacterized YigZ family protein
MLFETEYKTVQNSSEGLYKEKGSKFLAFCKHLKSVDEFKSWLSDLKLMHPTAVHHCYAYRIGYDKSQFRMNDDGEPSGTAGKPIYNVILSKDLTNIGIVVVRYFGGSLLGVPGLINAYKASSLDALENNTIETKQILEKAEIQFDYLKMNDVMKIIKESSIKIVLQETTEVYFMVIETPIKNAERARSAFLANSIAYNYLMCY